MNERVVGWRGFAAGAVLGLAGCAAPPAALPGVQEAVTQHGGEAMGWPQTEKEGQARDAAVARLLANDLTPDTAVRIALLNSRVLQAQFEDLGLAAADLWAAGMAHNPTLFASTRWPGRAPRGPDAEFSLTADILDDLLIPVRRRVARTAVAAAQAKVAQAALDLALAVKVAVYGVLARQEMQARLQAVAAASALAGELARRQYEAGNISQLDREIRQAAAAQAQVDVVRAEARLQEGREQLNELLGLSGPQAQWTLAGALPALPAADPVMTDLAQNARNHRLDLAAARERLTVAQAALDLRRRTRLSPAAIDLGVDTERNPDGSRVTGPQVTLGLPLFDQGQADLARLESDRRRAEDEWVALGVHIEAEVRIAAAHLRAARTVALAYHEELLPQRQRILHDTQLNYNAMQQSPYALLLAKEAEQRSENAGIEALRDYWVARVQLERASGGKLNSPAP